MSLREALKGKLSPAELALVPRSFDIIGSKQRAVAIVEIPQQLKKRKKEIALALMALHKNVLSVLQKSSARRGAYRLYKFSLISGSRKTEVLHKESGCTFALDPRKVYFSPREGTERLRIAQKIKSEYVMVFFAGVGPFAIIASKHSSAKKIVGIELNPVAVRYFKRNIVLNKTKNVSVVAGDVARIAKKYYGMCDRVIMPLPESGYRYLGDALRCLKHNGTCHFYCFAKEDEIQKWKAKIKAVAAKLKRKIRFGEVRRVLPWGPRIWKMRIDFIVS